jgi:NTE family protein
MAGRFYFEDLMKRFVINKLSLEERKRVGIGSQHTPLPADLTFRQFFDLTGVDLVITGTNLSTNQSKYFSVGYTPEFPVIDAVGLSMAIPLIFKPVCSTRPYVHYEETDDYNKAYTGLWADGGILNNLPIHAFDHVETKQLSYKGNINAFEVARPSFESLVPFCDCVLGFTLASSRSAEFDFQREFRTVNPSVLGELITSKIYPTLVYPANSGQIPTIEEQASTIDIATGSLSVLDFAGPTIDTLNGRTTRSLEMEVLIREAEALIRQRIN